MRMSFVSGRSVIGPRLSVSVYGAIAKRLCSGLQSRLGRFDSGSRLQKKPRLVGAFCFFRPLTRAASRDSICRSAKKNDRCELYRIASPAIESSFRSGALPSSRCVEQCLAWLTSFLLGSASCSPVPFPFSRKHASSLRRRVWSGVGSYPAIFRACRLIRLGTDHALKDRFDSEGR
jgi:hypothetical protein